MLSGDRDADTGRHNISTISHHRFPLLNFYFIVSPSSPSSSYYSALTRHLRYSCINCFSSPICSQSHNSSLVYYTFTSFLPSFTSFPRSATTRILYSTEQAHAQFHHASPLPIPHSPKQTATTNADSIITTTNQPSIVHLNNAIIGPLTMPNDIQQAGHVPEARFRTFRCTLMYEIGLSIAMNENRKLRLILNSSTCS